MKYCKLFSIVFFMAGTNLLAQAAGGSPAKPEKGPNAFSAAIDAEITQLEKQFVAAAEAMPEDKFNASPETLNLAGSEFKGVRTYADQVKHVAADNFAIWAPLTGKPEPLGINAPNGPQGMKSRAEILKFLEDSFAYSHQAVAGLTAENALELVEFRGNKVSRMSLVILAFTHATDHYGQMVEYLRMNGIVPPASNKKGMQMPAKPSGK
ncbi:MAG TPA: DinB family protein [Terriglobales bacterium]|nr:DinB family protein [Terriglobales bacterium]